MFRTLKSLLSPRSVVGLQLEGTFMAAVQVSNPFNSPVVDKVAFHEVREPEQVSHELETFFQREGLNPEVLVTSLPTSQATIREIQVDFRNQRKLDRIIKYQMEPHVPHPIEDMVVDFFPSEPGKPILAMGIQKGIITRHLGILSTAHMAPQLVSLEDIALFHLFLKSPWVSGEHPVAILHASGERRVVQVIRGGRLEFIRVLRGNKNIAAQIKETLSLYGLKGKEPVREILITGRTEAEEGLVEGVRKQTGVEASLWRPFDQIRHGLGDLTTDFQTRLSVPLGLAIGMINGGSRRFNLLREEFALKESLNLSNLFIFMLCAVVLFLGLFTFQLYKNVSIQQKSHDALNARIRGIFMETFPGTTNIIRGREAAQMMQRISAETSQYRWLEEMTSEGTMLDALMVLSQRMAGYADVRVDNISVETGKINLDGRASSFKSVDGLKGRLTEGEAFKNVKLVSAKMDNKEQAVFFNFVLERSR